MKNLFSSFATFYNSRTSRMRGIYRKKGIRPGTDWKIISLTFIFIILCSACIHVFIYIGVKNNSWWGIEETDVFYQVKIDKKLLQTALERFNKQAEELQRLKETPSIQADPSL